MGGIAWEVIGGVDKGGIVVRTGQDKSSPTCAERLSTGALVKQVALVGDRLQYERLTGAGPSSGWVSIGVAGKALLARSDKVWEVIGGGGKGGVVVRQGQDTASAAYPDRLSTGAWVRALRTEGVRLQYERLTGSGPATGWVSTRLESNKDLLRQLWTPAGPEHGGAATDQARGGGDGEWNPYEILGIRPDATDAVIKSAFRRLSLKVHPDHCPDDPDAAKKFQFLTDVRNFLLDPRKRRMYNLSHGLLQQIVNVKWWAAWDDIFDEIAPAGEDEAASEPSMLVCRPQLAPQAADQLIDIVVFGATGIMGTLACMHLQRQLSGHTWAIAGRDERKLRRLEERFGKSPRFRGAMRIGAPGDMECVARMGRVVVDLTGPKFRVGGSVAEACVAAGVHYVEATGCAGDALAAKQVRCELDGRAKSGGVALMFFCGWSSVQVDFGVWNVVRHVRQQYGLPTRHVYAYRWFVGGGCWGGTHLLAYRGQDGLEAELKAAGPFLLGGEREGGVRAEDEDEKSAVQDPFSGMWVAMDSPPDNVVPRCTCELLDKSEPYGDKFHFKNWGLFPDKHSGSMALLGNKFLRQGYEQAVREEKIPPPGMGARERIRQESCITMVFVAEAECEDGGDPQRAYGTLVTGPGGMGDPYECSAVVAVEAATCAVDALNSNQQLRPGFGTPVYHLAHLGFAERLAALGNSFRIEDGTPPQSFFRNIVASASSITG